MLHQILIGTIVIFGTVFVQAAAISALNSVLAKFKAFVFQNPSFLKNTLVLSFVVIWLVIGLVLTSWLWAAVYHYLDALGSFEESLYFSIVTFSTLGFGDITLNEQWRLLSSMNALNGLILVGFNTAYLAQILVNTQQELQGNKSYE